MAKLKLNDKLIEDAVKYIEAGNYSIVVCNYLGIDESTWYRWKSKGEEDIQNDKNNIYCKFYKSIKKAEAVAEMRSVTIIQSFSRDNWQAAAWYLERKYKDRWSKTEKHEISGKDGGKIEIEDPRNKLLNKINQIIEKREVKK